MDPLAFCGKLTFLLLPKYYNVASTAVVVHGAFWGGWYMETPHAFVLLFSETTVQNPGGNSANVRHDGSTVYAAWY